MVLQKAATGPAAVHVLGVDPHNKPLGDTEETEGPFWRCRRLVKCLIGMVATRDTTTPFVPVAAVGLLTQLAATEACRQAMLEVGASELLVMLCDSALRPTESGAAAADAARCSQHQLQVRVLLCLVVLAGRRLAPNDVQVWLGASTLELVDLLHDELLELVNGEPRDPGVTYSVQLLHRFGVRVCVRVFCIFCACVL